MEANEMNAEKLIQDLKTVVRDAEELLRSTAGEVGDKAREAREKLHAAVGNAKATCLRLEERAVASAEAAEQMVREHPYQSLGIAFGAGMLLGVLLNRK